MSVALVHPTTGAVLRREGDHLTDGDSANFPVRAGVPRFTGSNYADNFGFQWNKFSGTQLDDNGELRLSRARFFAETGWDPAGLAQQNVLEVGSGAGRFSRVVLEFTEANLWSVDYSEAVEANWKSNGPIAPNRFQLFQASIYELPFPDASFDRVFCLGVLQHTPDFAKSVRCLVEKVRPGGEIVVDFYPINGWWTKLHAKYLLRPLTKRLSAERLLRLIEATVDPLTRCYDALHGVGLGALTRFLPIAELSHFPPNLTPAQRREWAVLDTFDAYSPEYDQPQRVADVAAMFRAAGAEVTFAGTVRYEYGEPTVVRAVRRAQA